MRIEDIQSHTHGTVYTGTTFCETACRGSTVPEALNITGATVHYVQIIRGYFIHKEAGVFA
jgi:hypothetical protein